MIFFAILLQVTYTCAGTLKFVNVVHRHGDRTALDTYPTDPYSSFILEQGLGQLTQLGKTQMYDLGRYIRTRYQGFLPLKYNDEDIYVESSDVNRTIMSAQLLPASLYQPEGNGESPLNIPVNVIPQSDDNKILNSAPCPKFDDLLENQNELSAETIQKIQQIQNDLSQYTGLNLNYSSEGLDRSATVYDTLNTEEKNGFTLPEWTADFYPEPLQGLTTFVYYVAPFYSTTLRRLRCGPLIKDIIQHFDDNINGGSKLKIWKYSGHDTTIGNALICLNVFDYVSPPPASAVFIELYQNGRKDFEVLITYRKEETDEILILPGCSEYCPLDRFKELAREIIPDNWNAECNS